MARFYTAFLALLASATAKLVTHDDRFQPDEVLRISQIDAALACVYRTSAVVNGTTPGPLIRLTEGKTTWIRVYNDMPDQNATVVGRPVEVCQVMERSANGADSIGMVLRNIPRLSPMELLWPRNGR
jgi:hypothetical protein